MTNSLKALVGTASVGAIGLGGYLIHFSTSKDTTNTVAKFLKDKGMELLSFEGDTHKAVWESRVKELNEGSLAPALVGYKKSSEGDNDKKKAADVKKVQEICKSLLKSDLSDEFKLEQARYWCIKDKAPSK